MIFNTLKSTHIEHKMKSGCKFCNNFLFRVMNDSLRKRIYDYETGADTESIMFSLTTNKSFTQSHWLFLVSSSHQSFITMKMRYKGT